MKVRWKVEAKDVEAVKELVARQRSNALVRRRRQINCSASKPAVTEATFWRLMVNCRLTTQQRSGPASPISQIIYAKPYPLSYQRVRTSFSPEAVMRQVLEEAEGIRFRESILNDLVENFEKLEDGEWGPALEMCNRLTKRVPRSDEVEVASYIGEFKGFGPKQSRNLLQGLGLTRFEIPIDSRVTKWLNGIGFGVKLSAEALSDINYYNFVSDGIQMLCREASVFPCVFDAAVFTERDSDEWTDEHTF